MPRSGSWSLPSNTSLCATPVNLPRAISLWSPSSVPTVSPGGRFFISAAPDALTVWDVDRCLANQSPCVVQWPNPDGFYFAAADLSGTLIAALPVGVSTNDDFPKFVAIQYGFNLSMTQLGEKKSDFFLEQPPRVGAIDSVANTFYTTATANTLVRAHLDKFYLNELQSVSVCTGAGSAATHAITILPNGFAIVFCIDSTSTFMTSVRLASCTSHQNASSCLSESHYCTWWFYDQKCLFRSQSAPYCSGVNASHCVDSVPQILSVVPTVGSTAGGTFVTIQLTKLWPDSSIQCLFGSTTTVGTFNQTTNTVTCLTPSGPAGQVTVNVMYKGKKVAPQSTVEFTYYNCSTTATCYSCTTFSTGTSYAAECAWCPLSHKCLSHVSQSCPYTGDGFYFATQQCPVLGSISPRTGPKDAPTNVTLTCTNLKSGGNYSCTFGATVVAASAVDVSEGTVTCEAPAFAPGGTVNVSLLVTVLPNPLRPFVDSDVRSFVQFDYYSCPTYDSCDKCTQYAACAWCIDPVALNFTCIAATETCPSSYMFLSPSQCPSVVSLTPDSYDLELTTPGPTVDVAIKTNVLIPSLSYYCNSNSTLATINQAASTLTCPVQSATTEIGRPLKIIVRDASGGWPVFLDAGSFWFYNCSRFAGCATCGGSPSGHCGWCMASKVASCTPEWRCSGLGSWSNPICPTVEGVSPDYYNVEGSSITLSGPAFPTAARDLRCVLTVGGVNVSTVAPTSIDSRHANCTFPAISGLATVNATVPALLTLYEANAQDASFSPASGGIFGKSIVVVNCAQQDTATTCSACVSPPMQSLCTWSRKHAYCTTVDRAVFPIAAGAAASCPTLGLLDPATGVETGGAEVLVIGSGFINDTALTLRLLGGSGGADVLIPTRFINTTHLGVTMPRSTVVGRFGVDLVIRGRVYASNPLMSFDYTPGPANLTWIVGPIAAGVLLICAAIVAAALLISRKRRGLWDFRFNITQEPDFDKYKYATDVMAAGGAVAVCQRPSDKGWASLAALLQTPPVAAAVCDVTQATESDRVANALVYVHAASGRAVELLLAFVTDEVQSVPHENQLFRGNSMASKSFRAYTRIVGLRYLWKTLGQFVNELAHLAGVQDKKKDGKAVELEEGAGSASASSPSTLAASSSSATVSILSTEIEVDPTKMADGADEESQAYLLAQRSRALLLSIMKSIPDLPLTIRWIVHNIREQVLRRFPGSEHIAIGGTIFLRFICPAITVPHTYALLKNPPKDRLQRQLILLGKVLQNLANGVLFGKKEPFMNNMNEFIAKNIQPLHDWMDSVADVGGEASREEPIEVPTEILAGSLSFMHGHISANLPKVRAALQTRGAPPQLIQQLENALGAAAADR